MTIVDRYIVKKFFTLFFLICLSLFLLFVVIDASANLSDFLSPGGSTKSLALLILEYYSLYFFRFIDIVFPMTLLGSAAATLVAMWNRNEIIALLANGVSPARILAPLFIGGFIVSIGFSAFREGFVSSRVVELGMNPKDFVSCADEIEANRAVDDKTKLSIDGDRIVLSKDELIRPKAMLSANLNRYGNRVIAKKASHMPRDGARPAGWKFSGVSAPAELLKSPSLKDEKLGETIIFTPNDCAELAKDEVFIVTNISPHQISAGDNWLSYGPLLELFSSMKDPCCANRVHKLAIHAYTRCFRPLTDVLPLFLGLPFAFLGRGKGLGIMLIYGASLGLTYEIFMYICAYLGDSFRIAAVAVWAPMFIFIPVAANVFAAVFRNEY